MIDVSGNDNVIEHEESSSSSGGFNPSYESEGEDYVSSPSSSMEIPDYYSGRLENIETALQFQTAIIIGFLLLVGFICGWKK